MGECCLCDKKYLKSVKNKFLALYNVSKIFYEIVLVVTVTIKLYVVFVEENKTGLNGRNVTMIITLTVSP